MSELNLAQSPIAHVVSYYPPHLGGMERVAAQLADGLADKGYAISVYTSNIGISSRVERNSNARIHYLKSIEFAHTPVMFSLFFRLLTLPRRSLIHLHVAHALSPEVVLLISKLRGISYIAHIHLDVDPTGTFGFLLGPYKRLFLKRVLKSAAKIICLSEEQKHLIASKYSLPLASITVIPNGVAETYFVDKKTRENAVPHLLVVGRLTAQKNISVLIEAVAQMQTNVILDVVGEGELKEDLEAVREKHKLQNVKLHGRKSGDALLELYKTADVFVLPSLKEGLSLAMLEALAAGLPVVASDLPELRHVLGECGVLIQSPTATNYAKALDTLLANRATMRRLSDVSIQVARAYSWESVFACVEAVYEDVYKEIKA